MSVTHWPGLATAVLGFLLYAMILAPIKALPRLEQPDALRLVLPGYIEVILAGGDRHLAANIGVFRAMMVGGGNQDALTYEAQGKIQRQVAVLNPRQEDNSYIASAILPWWDQVAAAQFVLGWATESRYWDFMPPFFQGFNEYYFNKDYAAAAALVALSAERTDGVNREAFKDIAAKWYTRGDDPRAAIGVITALMQSSQDPRMQRRLQARIDRLQGLVILRDASDRYYGEHTELLTKVSQLQQLGYVNTIPADPFRLGYLIDGTGKVQLRNRKKP